MAYVAHMATLEVVANITRGDNRKFHFASWIVPYEGCCYRYKTTDINITKIAAYINENLPW